MNHQLMITLMGIRKVIKDYKVTSNDKHTVPVCHPIGPICTIQGIGCRNCPLSAIDGYATDVLNIYRSD